jgi:hypothetical protein
MGYSEVFNLDQVDEEDIGEREVPASRCWDEV